MSTTSDPAPTDTGTGDDTGNPPPIPPIVGEGGELYGDASTTPADAPPRPDTMPDEPTATKTTSTTKKSSSS